MLESYFCSLYGSKAKKLESQAKKVFTNTILVNDFDQVNIPMKGAEE